MKMTPYLLIGSILLVFWATSCGNKKLSAEGTDTSIMDSNKQQELFVWVENARIRKEADIEAGIITEIKGGEGVILTGEVSTNRTKVNLRGVDFEDVWVKVKTKDQKEGWIFKGMLTDNEEKAKAMNDFLISPAERVGQIKLSSTQTEIEQMFGKEFITRGEIYFTEGEALPGFYVFKNSPLEVQCVTDKEEGIITLILIRQPSAPWATTEGVKIGTKLDDLVKMNGKPIKFSGFGWDYGGDILSFNGGKLAIYDNNLGISLGEPDNLEGLDEFMGDQDCVTNKAILNKGVKVAELTIFEGAIM